MDRKDEALDKPLLPASMYRRIQISPDEYISILVTGFLFLLASCAGRRRTAHSVPPAPARAVRGDTLVWNDEFNGPNGSKPDPAKWTYDIGGRGWGNKELETYTRRLKNAYLENGNLVIQADKEIFKGSDGIERSYTSARLKTKGLFQQTYGRFEARIKIPYGQGMWPAFWMLGDCTGKAGWPACGEIDIMENIGREPAMIHGTIHGPGYSGAKGITSKFELPSGARFADDFHVYAVEWQPDLIRFSVDNIPYKTITPASLPPGTHWVYDHPFYIILNVAVGGSWPGAPDSTTEFPQKMLVDYVRVYQLNKK
jgi:beta-glucanase (GH16 family)